MSTQSLTEVIVCGLSPTATDDVVAALEFVAPGRFHHSLCDRGLTEVDPDDPEAIILAGCEHLTEANGPIEVVRGLRTRRFHWGPIHLLNRSGASNPDHEWAVYQHGLPPDVRSLATLLETEPGVTPAKQAQIIRAACGILLEDVAELRRAVSGRLTTDDRIRESLEHTRTLLTDETDELKLLRANLNRILASPTLSSAEVAETARLVVDAEGLMAKRPDKRLLHGSLHQLANVLRLTVVDLGDVRTLADTILKSLDRLSNRCEALGRADSRRLREGITRITTVLKQMAKGAELANGEASVHQFATTVAEIAYRAGTMAVVAPVQRIVVVEDDPDWRRAIINSLRDIGLGDSLPIQEAECAADARTLLRSPTPALVLVDLGLPEQSGGEISLDAGLRLIRDGFKGSGTSSAPHRFIILTGAENHSEIVRSAVSSGLSASKYLQKHPAKWDGDLRATVRLALQTVSTPPVIGLFPRTARVVRLASNEFNLDYPDWCLLAALAEHPGRWMRPATIARRLTQPPFGLKPGGNSTRAATGDPEMPLAADAGDVDLDEIEPDLTTDDDGMGWLRNRLADYVYAVRQKLHEAYARVYGHAPPSLILESSSEFGYRVNAKVVSLDFADSYRPDSLRQPDVLIVEDDPDWGGAIKAELRARGFQTRHVMSVETAEDAVNEAAPDTVCLDLELPLTESDRLTGKIDPVGGVTLLKRLRAAHPRMRIAILSGVAWKDDVMLEILRQDVHVDDYVQKAGPESIQRVSASLGRLWQEYVTETSLIDWDPETPRHAIEMDQASGLPSKIAGHAFSVKGGPLEVLRALSKAPNRFVSRTELIEQLWPDPDQEPSDPDNALDLHISRLRRSISQAAGVPGDEVICGSRGVLWLHGNVRWV